MEQSRICCDLCLGDDFEPYLESGPCGRSLHRCRGCGLVTASSRASQVEAPGAGDPDPRSPRTDRRRAAAVMRILPAGKVLEVGCGEGSFLSELDPARYEAVGTEPHQRAATEAGRRISEARLRGAVLLGTLSDAALPAETFDLVALFCSIGRAASPRATCMEVSRLLRPGGYAVIETPSLTSLTAMICGARWGPLRDPRAGYFFTPASLERLVSICGLTPGAARLTFPAGWPAPGSLVYVARKSCIAQRVSSLQNLAAGVGTIAPIGAGQ